ncbi:MAG: transglycosylase domain-containing protein [Myxococcaceae bacterium]|nr:transglycosylase domain-containing protein [Myxococcaceae bacterium]
MRNLRVLLWLFAMAVVVVVIVGPAAYFYTLAQLPALDSEFDLDRVLRQSVESERKSYQLGLYDKTGYVVDWPRPTFDTLPKNLVAAYITERGCPSYFQTPREDGWAWNRRILWSLMGKELQGDGWCEQVFAEVLAQRVGAQPGLQLAVATHRIHRFLPKNALVAYDLHSVQLAPGVVGVEAASKALMKKSLDKLNTAEIAELALALPPNGYWDNVKNCQNTSLLRLGRDTVVRNLARAGMIPESESQLAVAQPLACMRSE